MRKIGILCPSDEELAPFLEALVSQNVSRRAGLTIHEGLIGAHPVAALYSGVCKVNAAIAAQTLIEACGVDALVVSGVAGGLDAAVRPFDLVIACETAYHDVAEDILTEYHPWMESIWFQSDAALIVRAEAAARTTGARLHTGRIVTGEAFIDGEAREEIVRRYSPLAVDMETAAAAHVARAFGVPFIALRAITDGADESGADDFEKNCASASAVAARAVIALLKEPF